MADTFSEHHQYPHMDQMKALPFPFEPHPFGSAGQVLFLHGSKALGSVTWLCSCQQHTLTQDFTLRASSSPYSISFLNSRSSMFILGHT